MATRNDTPAGENLMASTWTKAAKLRRSLRAGRQRRADLVYSAESAAMAARIFQLEVRRMMMEEGIPFEDIEVALLMVTPESAPVDMVQPLPVPKTVQDFPRMSDLAEKFEREGLRPLGLAVWLKDREAEAAGRDAVSVWTQAWLTGPTAERALAAAEQVFTNEQSEEPFIF